MTRPGDFSDIALTGDPVLFLEERRAYTGSDVEYLGYCKKPNASTAELIWYIVKYTYVGGLRTRQQLPNSGPKFAYAWDDRATYFA